MYHYAWPLGQRVLKFYTQINSCQLHEINIAFQVMNCFNLVSQIMFSFATEKGQKNYSIFRKNGSLQESDGTLLLHTHGACTHMQTNIRIYKNKSIKAIIKMILKPGSASVCL